MRSCTRRPNGISDEGPLDAAAATVRALTVEAVAVGGGVCTLRGFSGVRSWEKWVSVYYTCVKVMGDSCVCALVRW